MEGTLSRSKGHKRSDSREAIVTPVSIFSVRPSAAYFLGIAEENRGGKDNIIGHRYACFLRVSQTTTDSVCLHLANKSKTIWYSTRIKTN
jgi:hypothetical protein